MYVCVFVIFQSSFAIYKGNMVGHLPNTQVPYLNEYNQGCINCADIHSFACTVSTALSCCDACPIYSSVNT